MVQFVNQSLSKHVYFETLDYSKNRRKTIFSFLSANMYILSHWVIQIIAARLIIFFRKRFALEIEKGLNLCPQSNWHAINEA